MATELAFSIEFNDTINAERAYELYWADVITDKRAFLCPEHESGCPAKYTCANMDTEQLQLKQVPHFRNQHDSELHMEGCPHVAELDVRGCSGESRPSEVGQPAPDRFLLTRPVGHFDVRQGTASETDFGAGGRSGSGEASGTRSRRTQFYSLAALVSRWLKARQDNMDDTMIVSAGTQEPMTYRELFENFFEKRPYLSGNTRVYWSKAWIRKTDDGFKIIFCEPITALVGEMLAEPLRPSAMVWNSVLAASEMKSLHARRLQRFAESEAPCVVFLYGTPALQEKHSRTYLNFDVKSLDLVDVQGTDIFDRIRRPQD
ncbi:hypothetical protein BA766_19140 [Stenotrophomonas maltophilia]|uniref:Uncharacterized protein n=2 Tax=Stenotrophomonas maltophilia TaxID=40324 RepID=B4SHQ0_STRM5|nr:hypothetical protein Smal_0388 [Stenotrophomonas maltophilia R551-3]OCK45275.1 hypothetical protein BA766_19140 [Stenotrophomonas maltophilia]